MTAGVTERLSSADAELLSGVIALYHQAIPASERKPDAALRAMLASPDYVVTVHRAGDAVRGFCAVFAPQQPAAAAAAPFALVEYLAVNEAHRGQGIGGRLFTESLALAFRDRPSAPALVEVESADPSASAINLEVQHRRQRFYRRLGCLKVNALPYILPLSIDPPPPAMDLMIYFPSAPFPIPRPMLERWLRKIYADVYSQPPTDPRIDQMLTIVTDPIEVR